MSFEAFYDSPAQHPWLLWAAALLATLYAVTRRDLDPVLRRYCAALGALSLMDAWLTSKAPYGVGPLGGTARSLVPLFFVLAGDFRYLLLAVAATPEGRPVLSPGALARAAAWTLLVPLFSRAVLLALPETWGGPRTLFLVYELAFFALAWGLAAGHPNVQRAPWLQRLSAFVMVYYGLWAAADAVILATGSDLGFALRVVPNLLYYGGLIAAVARLAPRRSAPA